MITIPTHDNINIEYWTSDPPTHTILEIMQSILSKANATLWMKYLGFSKDIVYFVNGIWKSTLVFIILNLY